MTSNEEDWSPDFIQEIRKISRIFRRWANKSVILNKKIFEPIPYQIQGFPFSENSVFESQCLNSTIAHAIKSNRTFYSRKDLTENHVYNFVLDLICETMSDLWGNLTQKACQDQSGYIDWLIRSSIPIPDGFGIGVGYLCLYIARDIRINKFLREKIDVSFDICPILPFNLEQTQNLIQIARSESKLRLALLLFQELTLAAKEAEIQLSAYHFPASFWWLFAKIGFCRLEIFERCFIQSKECTNSSSYYGEFASLECSLVTSSTEETGEIHMISHKNLENSVLLRSSSVTLSLQQ